MSEPPILEIEALTVENQSARILDGVSMTFRPNTVSAIVGASGSGKSMLAKCVNGLLPPGVTPVSGRIRFEGRDLLQLSPEDRKALRGRRIGLIFQDALSALNPVFTIGEQLREAQRLHFGLAKALADEASEDMLAQLQMPSPRATLALYPHELSGGLRQRAMIASQLLLKPTIVFADEPTTALDSLVQHKTLSLLVEACTRAGAGLALISHDLGVVYRIADTVHVMKQGKVVESGATKDVIAAPAHAYTRELLEASPSLLAPSASAQPAPAAQPFLRVRDLGLVYREKKTLPWRPQRARRALSGVSFDVHAGKLLAVIGGSGSGKSSMARALLGLAPGARGEIELDGRTLALPRRDAIASLRRQTTLVFQDSFASLDPRFKISACIAEGLTQEQKRNGAAQGEVAKILEMCELPRSYLDLFPHQLSGGERQRVAIARALVSRPKCIIADEPVSALDLSVQKSILSLFDTLKREMGVAIVLISHDLAVVRSIADEILVLNNGRIVERGAPQDIFTGARHPYTLDLLSAAPRIVASDGRFELTSFEASSQAGAREATFWSDDSDPFGPEPQGYALKPLSPTHSVAYRT